VRHHRFGSVPDDSSFAVVVNQFDRRAVAARVKELIGGLDPEKLAAASERLRVDELALRLTVDELSPHPTMEVLVAVVREYGVDPHWLLTGEYVGATHRRAMEEGVPGIIAAMNEISRKRNTPPSEPLLRPPLDDTPEPGP
jgi:hypothetical protein